MSDVTSAWLAALKRIFQSAGQLGRDQTKGGNPMNDFRLAWAAFKNMLRAAARDPLWAFVAIVTAPFRAAGYVARMGALFILVLVVVGGGLMFLMQWAGIQRGDVLWYVGNLTFTAFLVLVVFRLVSDLLGQETAVFKTMGQALDSEKSGISYGEHHSGRPLLTPDEVRSLPQNVEMLFLAGQRPILAGKLAYYADPEFRGLFDAA